jgi:hypothetical protein
MEANRIKIVIIHPDILLLVYRRQFSMRMARKGAGC